MKITFNNRIMELQSEETVLSAMERNGIPTEASCRSGFCQSCIMKATEGSVPASSQVGIKSTLKIQNYFLPCICIPTTDLVIEKVQAVPFYGDGKISNLEKMSGDVIKVSFATPNSFEFKAGQFITLTNHLGISRSYSIASLPNETNFEIHVRKVFQGKMSTWFFETAKVGDTLKISGPKGECFYVPDEKVNALTLIGTGTGMAPLLAIGKDAINSGFRGAINIYDGGLNKTRLYLAPEILKLSSTNKNITYYPCVLEGIASPELNVGDLCNIVLNDFNMKIVSNFYLCGDPAIVLKLRKQLFLKGASLKRIFADAFVGTSLT